MEGEAETREVLPTSPIRNLVGGDPSSAEFFPVEGILLLLSFFTSLFYYNIHLHFHCQEHKI